MRRTLWMSLMGTLLGVVAIVASQERPPVFHAAVELVTLDVSVLDRQGRPVRGLQPKDFVVELDGKPSNVSVANYVDLAPVAASGTLVAPSQSGRGEPTPARAVFVLVDDLSFDGPSGRSLSADAANFVASLTGNDLAGLATTSGRNAQVRLSTDRRSVIAALRAGFLGRRPFDLKRVNSVSMAELLTLDPSHLAKLDPPPVDETAAGFTAADYMNAMIADVTATQERALVAERRSLVDQSVIDLSTAAARAAAALQQAPAPRVLIVLSDGIGLSGSPGMFSTLRDVAKNAGIQLYVLMNDAKHLFGSPKTGGNAPDELVEDATTLLEGLETATDFAGGTSYRILSSASRPFADILRSVSGIYRLGVETEIASAEQPFTSVAVRARRSDVTVRTATRIPNMSAGMAAVGPPTPASVDDRLRELLRGGGVEPAVPLSASMSLRRAPSGGLVQVVIGVAVPPGVTGAIRGAVALLNELGNQVWANNVPELESGVEGRLAQFFANIQAGRYVLRVAVADADGNIGAMEQTMVARLHPVGGYFSSDLLLWSVGANLPRPLLFNLLPAETRTVRAGVELYASEGTSPVSTVTFAVLRDGDDQVLVEQAVRPGVQGTTSTAIADLPIDALAQGDYVIRAVVSAGQTEIGSIRAALRKGTPAVR